MPAPPTRSVHGMKWEREMLPEKVTQLVVDIEIKLDTCVTHCQHILPAFLTTIEAAVKVISELLKPGICSFFSDYTANGCTVRMENNKHVFVFNVTRSNNNDDNLPLLECFSVPEGGEYSVSVHEIHYGVVQEHVYTQVNITVWITESMPSVQWVPLNIIQT